MSNEVMNSNQQGLKMREALLEAGEMGERVDKIEDEVHNMEDALVSVFTGMEWLSETMRIALVNTPWQFIPEWTAFPQNHDYFRSQAVRMEWNKYLFPDGGRLDAGQTPATSPRCWLFRDQFSFDPDGEKRLWTRNEFHLQNFWRWDESASQTNRRGWFRTKNRVVHGATPPPNDEANWEYMGTDNPPQ